jgi:hypothetical protein
MAVRARWNVTRSVAKRLFATSGWWDVIEKKHNAL